MAIKLTDKRYVKIEWVSNTHVEYSIYENQRLRTMEQSSEEDYEILLESIAAEQQRLLNSLPTRIREEHEPILTQHKVLCEFVGMVDAYVQGHDCEVAIPLFEGRPFTKRKIESILKNMRTGKITATTSIRVLEEGSEELPLDLTEAYRVFKEKGFLGFDTEDC